MLPIYFWGFEYEMKFSVLKISSTYAGWNSESLWIFPINFHTAVSHPLWYHWMSVEKFWFWDHDTLLVVCNDHLFGVWVYGFHPFQGAKSFFLRAVVISQFSFFSSCNAKLNLLKCKKSFLATSDSKYNEKYLGSILKLPVWDSITYIFKNC